MKILLTGIKPTGIPHIGNYLGVIKPALKFVSNHQTFFFIADYHALNAVKDPVKIKHDVYDVAATWLACGLDPDKTTFYRQSRIPEITELTIILSNVTPKGLMNRSHAYKAILQDNAENHRDMDKGVNMGLYNYPLLMAADILMFQTERVPVGKDQIQHVEITRDIAESFNRNYGVDHINFPEAVVDDQVETIIGTDGRKMSKSYNNIIPIFGEEKKIRKEIMKIVTNSQGMEEVKDPELCPIYHLFKHFSDKEEQASLSKKYLAGGMGWGEAKQILYEKMVETLRPMKEKYDEIKDDHSKLDDILAQGEKKAREVAIDNLHQIKKIIGII